MLNGHFDSVLFYIKMSEKRNFFQLYNHLYSERGKIMDKLMLLKEFEEIYKQTYKQTLKYIICKCNNLEDVNDIIQDTYVELYKNLKKEKELDIDNINAYIIGISKNIVKKYYKNKREKTSIIELPTNEDIEIRDIFDLEEQIITKMNVEKIWEFIKNKNVIVAKIFYLYYSLDMKIIDISAELNLTQSNIKNYIYRTLKEIKEKGVI